MDLFKEEELRILTLPDSEAELRKPSKETSYKECLDARLMDRLHAACSRGWVGGQGLAAVQVGVHLRMAFYKDPNQKDGASRFLINPRILHAKDLRPHLKEGCLSIPDRRFNTWRFNEIVYEKLVSGRMEQYTAKGIEAIIIQHELDHMDGVLCCDRVQRRDLPQRNDPCACGSGKKYKKCCIEVGVPPYL